LGDRRGRKSRLEAGTAHSRQKRLEAGRKAKDDEPIQIVVT